MCSVYLLPVLVISFREVFFFDSPNVRASGLTRARGSLGLPGSPAPYHRERSCGPGGRTYMRGESIVFGLLFDLQVCFFLVLFFYSGFMGRKIIIFFPEEIPKTGGTLVLVQRPWGSICEVHLSQVAGIDPVCWQMRAAHSKDCFQWVRRHCSVSARSCCRIQRAQTSFPLESYFQHIFTVSFILLQFFKENISQSRNIYGPLRWPRA